MLNHKLTRMIQRTSEWVSMLNHFSMNDCSYRWVVSPSNVKFFEIRIHDALVEEFYDDLSGDYIETVGDLVLTAYTDGTSIISYKDEYDEVIHGNFHAGKAGDTNQEHLHQVFNRLTWNVKS